MIITTFLLKIEEDYMQDLYDDIFAYANDFQGLHSVDLPAILNILCF